jgi:hypothetical protein
MTDERGSSVVEGLLALGVVLVAVTVGAELVLYVEARTVAVAAAQAGARAAASGGADAGLAAARAMLAVGGGLAAGLEPEIETEGDSVSAAVSGPAPALFRIGFLLPRIRAVASLPVESYGPEQQETGP